MELQSRTGISLMETLIAVAIIIIIIIATAWPFVDKMQRRKAQVETLNRMKQPGSALAAYRGANDDMLPAEDSEDGENSWRATENADRAWFNALPRALNKSGVGDYVKARNEAAFYTADNILFLPSRVSRIW